jgi:hypothetical protein
MGTIESMLSDKERLVLEAYRNPGRDLNRAIRLSIQYALGTALFVYLAIYDDALWSLAVYGIFLSWMTVRIIRGRSIAGVMPAIIEKYEGRIQELERSAGHKSLSDHHEP